MDTRLKLPLAKHPLSISLREEAKQGGGQKIKFVNPNTDNYETNIRSCAARGLPMVQKMVIEGETAIVCGSGPSLNDPEVLERIAQEQDAGAVTFACKAAISHLHDHGLRVDYGISMDPGAHIADPRKIKKVPGVVHIIASSSDPELFDYLMGDEHGEPAEVWVFHSACGFQKEITEQEYEAMPEEDQRFYNGLLDENGNTHLIMSEAELYAGLFPSHDVMGGGFNVVNRAVSLATYMGARKIILAGADSGWRDGAEMYCDGPAHRPGIPMTDKGLVDGTNWNTRPDMLASAVAMAKFAKLAGPDQFEIIGDTLPASLVTKDDAYLDQVASF